MLPMFTCRPPFPRTEPSAPPHRFCRDFLTALTAAAALVASVPRVWSQEPDAPAATAASELSLADRESRLAERFDRLELLAERLAELSSSTQPRRARVLRELVARSRDRDLAGDFDQIIAALEGESYSAAMQQQAAVQSELAQLLELLLQEDRDSQIESDRKRIGAYLKELKLIIRMQRGVKGRTDGGDDAEKLAGDQQRIEQKAGQLGGDIQKSDGSQSKDGQPSSGQSGEGAEPGDSDKQAQDSSDSPTPQEQEQSGDQQDGDQPEESAQSGDKPSGDQQSGEGQQNQSPSDQQSPGQQSQGQQSQGQQSQGQQSQGGGQSSPSQSPPQQNQSPADKAVERIRQAQQRMQQAQERLEKSQREGAVEEQEQALQELEQAKAELERILRQLREEELERTLVLLEARLRKMLEAQIEVYEQTKKLDAATEAPVHEREIAAARLSRSEQQIIRDAERALILLREDGTSVAFPEAIEQARGDMEMIADRLTRLQTSLITQGLEEDVIASLEESLAAMQRALQELREQQARGGQQQPGGGEPGEQPLVARIAELRMIRSLQARVNGQTRRYGALIEGELAFDAEIRAILDELALRQQRIFQAAHDLDTDENR
ncbi:MAG: hypothetical protein CMJ58_18400 [Planctomycetaceae bacterium]|nr:hypothetical protein [Planctomycetaceae bacterium]